MSEYEGPYWLTTTLDQMTDEQWEGLCDGCGRCCLLKLENEDASKNSPERFVYTSVACQLLNCETGGCSDYADRLRTVPDCVVLDVPTLDRQKHWMPETCAYRRLAEGRALPAWHPLLTGDGASVADAGFSVVGLASSERDLENEEDLLDHIIAPFHLGTDG